RLKQKIRSDNATLRDLFQFHNGSIKTGLNRSKPFVMFYFNSTMVRLKPRYKIKHYQPSNNVFFNFFSVDLLLCYFAVGSTTFWIF
ncbi:MAG: hypothetical protein ABFD00_01630, partial [Chloroherpetonaceae bacterium]